MTLDELRTRRDLYLRGYHGALRIIRRHGLHTPLGLLAADAADIYEARWMALDAEIDVLIPEAARG